MPKYSENISEAFQPLYVDFFNYLLRNNSIIIITTILHKLLNKLSTFHSSSIPDTPRKG